MGRRVGSEPEAVGSLDSGAHAPFPMRFFNHQSNEFSRMGSGFAEDSPCSFYSCVLVRFVVQMFSAWTSDQNGPLPFTRGSGSEGKLLEVSGSDSCRRRLRGFAALQEIIPADAGEEQERGGDLTGLGDRRGVGRHAGEKHQIAASF